MINIVVVAMSNESHEYDESTEQPGSKDPHWLTWPNVVTSIRIVGSPGLVALAMAGQTIWLGLFAVVLVFTEWLDGFWLASYIKSRQPARA
jgi:hypothetical protein